MAKSNKSEVAVEEVAVEEVAKKYITKISLTSLRGILAVGAEVAPKDFKPESSFYALLEKGFIAEK